MAAYGRIVLALVPVLALFAGVPAGCFFTADSFQGGGGTGGAGGKASGSGGDAGQAAVCVDGTQCSDGNPCTDDVCENGTCKNPNNDTILPADPNPCTKDTCKSGVASHTNFGAGTPCGMDLKCDGAGICQCTVDAQCGASTTCLKKTCDMAKGCVETPQTDLILPDPTPHDCKGVKCDNTGQEVVYNEDADKPTDDGVVCTDDVCTNGVGSHPLSAEGTACMGSNVCDGAGMCTFCTPNFGCNAAAGEYCYNGAACPSCSDLSQDGDESDVNCGGAHCPKCVDGKTCNGVADCVNGNCNSGKCISCTDGVQNGAESDIDCGGTCPSKCALTKTCNGDGDCASGTCSAGKCVSCSDGIQNGSESDVDCGGACATKCAVGKICGNNSDCSNGKCADGYCCSATCTGDCKACNLPGKQGTCTSFPQGTPDPGTCLNSDLCNGNSLCQTPSGMGTIAIGDSCSGNVYCFNGNCAAGYCKLQTNDYCQKDWDCASHRCIANACQICAISADCPNMNTCVSGVCKLSNGEICKANGDCQSNFCGGNPKKCQ